MTLLRALSPVINPDESTMPASDLPLFQPDWSAPAGVLAFGSRRQGGVSLAPWDSLNLGLHVGDDPAHVLANRDRLAALLPAESRLVFVDQVHGTGVALAEEVAGLSLPVKADALVTCQPRLALVILTADCLPVFFSNAQGTVVGLAHAGWRGLAGGVLENTARRMREMARANGLDEQLQAAFGPAIGPAAFEVGPEVREAFLDKAGLAHLFFKPGPRPGKFLANLYGLASLRLGLADVAVSGTCRHCTVSEASDWFSYRRDGPTGRQASVILIRARIMVNE